MIPIIDNGHGIDTLGKRSPAWADGRQLFEWEFTRDVAGLVFDGLTCEGLSPHLLVPEQEDISVRERIKRANKIHTENDNSTILISIHGNATNGNPRPSGLETFHYKDSQVGKHLAEVVQDELVYSLGWKDRGARKTYETIRVKRRDGRYRSMVVYKIAITKYTTMPAILTENGFYTNYEQCLEMLTSETREKIAEAHIKGVLRWMNEL